MLLNGDKLNFCVAYAYICTELKLLKIIFQIQFSCL